MNLSSLKSSAPAIAVVLLLVGFLIMEFVVLPGVNKVEAPRHDKESVDQEKQTNTDTKNIQDDEISLKTTTSKSPGQLTPAIASTNWTTFHGGHDLIGYTSQTFPDKPILRWQYLADGAIFQPPVATSDTIYSVTNTGNVIALDYSGQPRWKISVSENTKENIEAPLVLTGATLLVGTQSGRLIALDAANGALRWEYNVAGQILGSPNADMASGTVYVLERSEGVLHALNAVDGTLRWKTDPIARCDGPVAVAGGIVAFGSCLPALHAYAATDGMRIAEIDLCADCQVAGGIALLGGEAYAGNRSGSLLRVDLLAGAITWKNEDNTKEVFSTPAIGPTQAIFTNEEGSVVAVDRATGAIQWQHPADGQATSVIILADKAAFSARGVLQFLRLETGAPIWSYEVSDHITAPSLAGELLLVGSEDGTIAAFGAPGAAQ